MAAVNTVNDLLLACTVGDISWLERGLVRGIDPHSTTKDGSKCLHLAAKNGMFECMKYLLENKINEVNDRVSSTGDTVMHTVLAANLGKRTIKFVRLLFENGIELDRKNKIGQAPLHLAAQFGWIKCLRFLLDKGVDITTTDNIGHTAYDLACLHGQHECARLLKALHWANKKDTNLDSQLKQEQLQRNQELEYQALQTKLRIKAAEYAYKEWLEQKKLSRSTTPVSSETRREIISRSSRRTPSCSTHSTTSSNSLSGISKVQAPKINSQIKVNHHQEHHNIDSVGKPKKLYPYSNHPPKHLRSSHTKMKQMSRSGRSSRATVRNTNRSNPKLIRQQLQHKMEESLSEPPSKQATHGPCKEDQFSKVQSESIDSDQKVPTESLQDSLDDEDLLFHDVGLTNNLDALSLPNVITKDKTQAELIQLLQTLGESSSKSLNRSHSVMLRRNSAHSIITTRRLSLGAIPEGRVVTSYSDEEHSTAPSQILDDSFIEELIKSLSSQEPHVLKSKEQISPRIVWDKEDTSAISSDVPVVELLPAEEQHSNRSSLTLSLANLQSTHSVKQTLKVVNMEWDPVSGSVQSLITVSPLTPPPDTHQMTCLSPKHTPSRI